MQHQNRASRPFSMASEQPSTRATSYQASNNTGEVVYWDAIKPRFYDRYGKPVTLETKLCDLNGFER